MYIYIYIFIHKWVNVRVAQELVLFACSVRYMQMHI